MDNRITAITARQLGLITRKQLTDLGLTTYAVQHLVQSGRLIRISRRVLRLSGIPIDDRVRVMFAVLDSGGYASHQTGAALWGLPNFSLTPAHVTRTRSGRVPRRESIVVHQSRNLTKEDTTWFQGIPLLRPPRLIFDIAATEKPRRTAGALDWMWSRRIVTLEALDRTMDRLAVSGRPGITVMRELIEQRRDQGPFGSNQERRFDELVAKAGLPEFRRQVDVGDDDGWVGRMDFVSSTHKLIIEVDSELHHSALSDRERDARRRRRLERAGYVVRVVNEADLFYNPGQVIENLRQWIREAPRY